jgi:hypothetical protein
MQVTNESETPAFDMVKISAAPKLTYFHLRLFSPVVFFRGKRNLKEAKTTSADFSARAIRAWTSFVRELFAATSIVRRNDRP